MEVVSKSGEEGTTLQEIYPQVNLSEYGVRVLLEAGLGIGLVLRNEDKYTLTKTGHFILNDRMDPCKHGFFE